MIQKQKALPKRVEEVVNGTLRIEEIMEDLEDLVHKNDAEAIHEIFKQIVKGCNSKSSYFVDNALKIIEELLNCPNETLMAEVELKEFQQALMYTLRGRTTRFGNTFSMHRETWRNIEDRVLVLYQKLYQDKSMGDDKYPNLAKNYLALKQQKIKFPQTTTFIQNQGEGSEKIQIQREKESLETFLKEYGKMIDQGLDNDIAEQIEFKVKEKLIYALNNVLLHEDQSVRLQVAILYNKRFNELISKLNNIKNKPSSAKLVKKPSSSKITPPPPVPQGKEAPRYVTKTSGIRSMLQSTISYLTSHSSESKNSADRQKVMGKLDETIGDLVKYFEKQDVKIENMPDVTRSSLY